MLINYHDPNPKGRPRKETVLFEKLPVTNRILKLDALLHEMHSLEIKEKGEILCAAQSNGIIYYLHCNKRVTAYSPLLGLIREINT